MGVSDFDPLQLKAAKTTTVKSLFERYIAEVGVKMKGINEMSILSRLVRDADLMLLSKITPRDIRDWRDHRMTQI